MAVALLAVRYFDGQDLQKPPARPRGGCRKAAREGNIFASDRIGLGNPDPRSRNKRLKKTP